MVTETNDLGTESTVEVTEIPLKVDESVETPAPAETPATEPVDDLTETDDSSSEAVSYTHLTLPTICSV